MKTKSLFFRESLENYFNIPLCLNLIFNLKLKSKMKKLIFYNGYSGNDNYTGFNKVVVPKELEDFTKDKVKNIRKCAMAQINTFYYPEKNPIYEIEVESYFNMFEILIDNFLNLFV